MLKELNLKMYLSHILSNIQKNSVSSQCVILRYHGWESPLNHKKRVSNIFTYNIQSEQYSTYTTEPASDFLHRVISIYFSHRCSPKIFRETELVLVSDPKNIPRKHYLEQPKSMLCRKLIRRFHE